MLLGDVALALTGRPVPRLNLAPRDLKSARANILVAMEHLGMLAELSGPALQQLAEGRQVGAGGLGVESDEQGFAKLG